MSYNWKNVIVAYDIEKDYIRNDIAELLKYHGLKRFQYSVFVGSINEKYLRELKDELKDYDLSEKDKIYIFTICKRCYDQRVIIGKEPPEEKEHLII